MFEWWYLKMSNKIRLIQPAVNFVDIHYLNVTFKEIAIGLGFTYGKQITLKGAINFSKC